MSARPRPVTATLGVHHNEQHLSVPRHYSFSSNGSTSSLVSILDHDSYESLQSDNNKEKLIAKSVQMKSFDDVRQYSVSKSESESEKNFTPWEEWLINKTREERNRKEVEAKTLMKIEEEKREAALLKAQKKEEAQQKIKEWVTKKNFELSERRKCQMKEEQHQKEILEEKKSDDSRRSQEKYEDWLSKKRREQLDRKKLELEKKAKENEKLQERKQKAQETYEMWCKAAKCRERCASHSYAYSSGKLTCYFDKTAYPEPSYCNPVPWQPVDVPINEYVKKDVRRYKSHEM